MISCLSSSLRSTATEEEFILAAWRANRRHREMWNRWRGRSELQDANGCKLRICIISRKMNECPKKGDHVKRIYLSSNHWFSGNILVIRGVSIDWLHYPPASQQYGPCFATIGSSFPLCIDIVGSIMLKTACSIGFNLHHFEVHTFRNRMNTPDPTLIESPLFIEQRQRNNTQINFAILALRFKVSFCIGFNSPRGHWFQRSWVGDQF